MAQHGAAPGERRGGRSRGTPNRKTTEREHIAKNAVIIAQANPQVSPRELAKDVLDRLMQISEGAAGLFKPTSPAELQAGAQAKPGEDWDRFGQWVDRTIICAKELAKYQSPTFRAIQSMGAPGDGARDVTPQGDNVTDIKDPVAMQRVYKMMIR